MPYFKSCPLKILHITLLLCDLVLLFYKQSGFVSPTVTLLVPSLMLILRKIVR